MYLFLQFFILPVLATSSLAASIHSHQPPHCLAIFLLFLVLVTNTLASPLPASSTTPPINESITFAAQNWLQDTRIVSSLLDYAVSIPGSTPPDLLSNAAEALTAELDELTHKALLDQYFLNTSSPNQELFFANSVLSAAGIFQFVVDKLTDISKTGNLSDVEQINVARCAWVLPAIDVYFEQVAIATNVTVFGLAIRPKACPVGSNFP